MQHPFAVSLRLRHPSIDPQEITDALGLVPSRSWRAGDHRTTPAGELLGGINDHTYWVARLPVSDGADAEVDPLAATIEHGLSVLEQHAEFMDHFLRPDASAELFVGYFGRVGSTLNWSLLCKRLSIPCR